MQIKFEIPQQTVVSIRDWRLFRYVEIPQVKNLYYDYVKRMRLMAF